MLFTQYYSGSTVCAPSRCALLTGLHTGHAPVRGNQEFPPEGQAPMPASTRTVADLLKQAGYATGVFGKWGLGAPGSASEPLEMGFDHFYGYNCQRMAHNYYPYYLWNDHQREMLWNNFGLERRDYAPEFIHRSALDFIRTNKNSPFFCYYALVQPHAEMLAPDEYMEKYRGKYLPENSYEAEHDPARFRRGEYASQPEAHAAFAAMVNILDDYVGEIIDELDRLGIADRTLIFFSSDNGPHKEGGHDPDYFDSNGPFRGYKRDLYDGGMHVPLIACWPGKIQAGTTSDHLSAFWDFFPTVAELTGQPVPQDTDGISMLPTLLGRPGQQEHDYLYWEFHEKNGRTALRKGPWKVVRYKVDKSPDSPVELYNLSEDPGETSNVASQYPEVAEELSALMKTARTNAENPAFNFSSR
jgi:arylsulfatase A-like enzyme